jgi:GTP cyclohydrolase I
MTPKSNLLETALNLKSSPLAEQVLNCTVQDPTGLNDFQKLPDQLGIAIPKVGITRFRLPLLFKHADGQVMNHDCEASMHVNLAVGKTGINMSRLCSILQDEASAQPVSSKLFKQILGRYRSDLRDDAHQEPKLASAYLKLKFSYPMKQLSLKSHNWGWQYYPVEMEASESVTGGFRFYITLDYEYSSTCPCSLSMAKQYENDFAQGLTNEGNGIGVAHGQRSKARVKVELKADSTLNIEDIVALMREAIPTETQSLVKRIDEQAFAILNGSHPMFVEHASKRLWKVLNQNTHIKDWIVSLEHYESLHSHNAAAVISKGLELQHDPLF